MKVGRWRRERMGEGKSHAREAIAVIILLLLFGVFRLYNVAEAEIKIENAQVDGQSQNVVLLDVSTYNNGTIGTLDTTASRNESIPVESSTGDIDNLQEQRDRDTNEHGDENPDEADSNDTSGEDKSDNPSDENAEGNNNADRRLLRGDS